MVSLLQPFYPRVFKIKVNEIVSDISVGGNVDDGDWLTI